MKVIFCSFSRKVKYIAHILILRLSHLLRDATKESAEKLLEKKKNYDDLSVKQYLNYNLHQA